MFFYLFITLYLASQTFMYMFRNILTFLLIASASVVTAQDSNIVPGEYIVQLSDSKHLDAFLFQLNMEHPYEGFKLERSLSRRFPIYLILDSTLTLLI